MDPAEALEVVDDIVSMAESDALPSAAAEFAESVSEKAQSIGETIEENNWVSDAQATALVNMRNGLRKWFRGSDGGYDE